MESKEEMLLEEKYEEKRRLKGGTVCQNKPTGADIKEEDVVQEDKQGPLVGKWNWKINWGVEK